MSTKFNNICTQAKCILKEPQDILTFSTVQKVHIIAASKTQPIEAIEAAKQAGIKHFGENYVQEAERKRDGFIGCTLHLIGHLQSNKAKQAAELFDVIHTIDSQKLATKLNHACEILNKTLLVFIQVNMGDSSAKKGIRVEKLASLVLHIRQHCPFLKLAGLMVLPPANQNPVTYFRQLKTLASQYDLKELSMGMTNDYKEAIKEGATYVRIGRAIFGERPG